MSLDEAKAIEMVVTYMKLTESYVRSVPVWTFYALVEEAKNREETMVAKSKA